MQTSLAYRPSHSAVPLPSWTQSGVPGTTGFRLAEFAYLGAEPSIEAAAPATAMHCGSVRFNYGSLSKVTIVFAQGTSVASADLRSCGFIVGRGIIATGMLSPTEGADTVAFSGGIFAAGTLSATEAYDVMSILGSVALPRVSYGPPITAHIDRDESNIDNTELPIWKKIQAITAHVPAQAWETVPRDLASHVDKYLYRKDDRR
jgi:hypothetical protein